MKGLFITFEGSEGCGKSTQSRLLCGYLRRKGRRVVYLREPGGTQISEKIRRILLDPKSKITPICEMLLYMASRAQVVREVIKPAIDEGKIIICDRFLDSTLAYQGFGLRIDMETIRRTGRLAAAGLKPDLTILLDLPVEKGLRHRKSKKDRIERRSLAYHNRVRQGYLALAKDEPGRVRIIRIEKDKSATQDKIRNLVSKIFKPYF